MSMSLRDEELQGYRLRGRHGDDFIAPSEYEDFAVLTDEDARAAYDEGAAARASGARCLCLKCSEALSVNADRERQRTEYRTRRCQELAALGVADEDAARIVEEEVSRGAALFSFTAGGQR